MEVLLGEFDQRKINTLGRVLEPLGLVRAERSARTATAFVRKGDWYDGKRDLSVTRYDGDEKHQIAVNARGRADMPTNKRLYETVRDHLKAKLVSGTE